MIRRHDFNSRWWGGDVGIVADEDFFALPEDARRAQLSPWAWVEHRGPLDPERAARCAAAGFAQVDAQLAFRIGLRGVRSTPSTDALAVELADAVPFAIEADELADFRHERFSVLRGATTEALNRRYALWSEELLAAQPEWCARVLEGGDVQGWFLAQERPRGLELTLAMLRKGARLSGHALYRRALLAFRERGARIGFASFSVRNTAVHNIYADLGARFVDPIGCWLWQPD